MNDRAKSYVAEKVGTGHSFPRIQGTLNRFVPTFPYQKSKVTASASTTSRRNRIPDSEMRS